MKLTDMMPIEKWMEFEKEIIEKSGLCAGVYDTGGIRITGYKKWANKLCPLINENEKTRTFICSSGHQNMAAQARAEKKGIAEECDAGLGKVVVPIFFEGEFIGAAGGCGLMFEHGEVETFYVAKTLDMDEKEIQKLSEGIGKISRKDTEALIDFIEGRIESIVKNYKEGGKNDG